MANSYVWEVLYQRVDGAATSPIVCTTVEYAGAVVQALLSPGVTNVLSVSVVRRPPMMGEVEGVR